MTKTLKSQFVKWITVYRFKGKNGTFVSLTVFYVFLKLLVVNDVNFINGINGRYSAISSCFLQLMALAVQQSASKCLLTVCQIVNSFNSLPKLQNFQKKSLACYQTGFTAQTNSLKIPSFLTVIFFSFKNG